MVFDSDTTRICEGCRYSFNPLNSTEGKFDWTFKGKKMSLAMNFVTHDYSWCFNGEVSKYFELLN